MRSRPAYQLMLEYLDVSVFFEIDTSWVHVAGLDPAAVVAELGSRAPLLHLNDGPGIKDAPMVALGTGVMDIPPIIAAGEGTTDYLIVELDHCASDMLTAVEQSYHYLGTGGLARGTTR